MSATQADLRVHAAHVVVASRSEPADRALRGYLAKKSWLQPGEKRQISRAVFAYHRWLGWLETKDPLPKQLAEADALQERFNRDAASFKVEALAARAVPSWLRDEMEVTPEFLRQIQREPSLWLRARPGTGVVLAAKLESCAPLPRIHERVGTFGPPEAMDALLYAGLADLFLTEPFRLGGFEIQDLTSQWVSWACHPNPGETWWDACAGEGGKALHLADLMANKGTVWATDRSVRRLEVLKGRAARAKLYNLRVASRPPRGAIFDGILIDAPCSGVGTWQRNPHARWTTGPSDVKELAAVQTALLDSAVSQLKAGGRLVYSVCTLTRAETSAVTDAFAKRHPTLEPLALALPDEPAGAPGSVTLWPQRLASNGMFVAAWKKGRLNGPA